MYIYFSSSSNLKTLRLALALDLIPHLTRSKSMVAIQFQPDHERNRNISTRPRRVDTSTAVTGTTSNEAAASYNRDVSRSMHIAMAMDEAPFTIDVCVPAHLYY